MTGDPSVQSVLLGFLFVGALVVAAAATAWLIRDSRRDRGRVSVTTRATIDYVDPLGSIALPNLHAIGWRPTDAADFARLDSQVGAALGRAREFVPFYRPGIDQVGAELPELHVPKGVRRHG